MNRKFRLTNTTDFKRVRQSGKSYAHPLLVLVKQSNELVITRVAVSAGRSVGNAVQRNRAKRLIREVTRAIIPSITPGWDLILLARQSISKATYRQVRVALLSLLQRAKLLDKIYDDGIAPGNTNH